LNADLVPNALRPAFRLSDGATLVGNESTLYPVGPLLPAADIVAGGGDVGVRDGGRDHL